MSGLRSGVELVARQWLLGWLAIAQLILDLLLAGLYITNSVLVLVGVLTVPVVFVGVPMLALALLVAFGAGYLERARLYALTGVRVRAPGPPDARGWRRLLDPRPWLCALHNLLIAIWGVIAGSVIFLLASLAFALALLPAYGWNLPQHGLTLPWGGRAVGLWWWPLFVFGGIALLVAVPLVARQEVRVDALLARWLLGPSQRQEVEQLSERVETLTTTRTATVESVEVERRRIERDLHDGPQQRLVAIAMDLGMAQERMERDPAAARELVDKAHSAAKEAIVEMRQVARGIHPPVLTDRGLDAAVSALAAGSPVPVSVRVEVPTRPSPTIEVIAYFCVSEALTNVAKHARAKAAEVHVVAHPDRLVVQVRDDGAGGADPTAGTGLPGLRDRVAAVDGRLELFSPPGGPTVLTVTLPLEAARKERTPS